MCELERCEKENKEVVIPSTINEETWIVPISDISEVTNPDRDHAYITPEGTVYVLNYDGTELVPINTDGVKVLNVQILNDAGKTLAFFVLKNQDMIDGLFSIYGEDGLQVENFDILEMGNIKRLSFIPTKEQLYYLKYGDTIISCYDYGIN